MIEFKLGDIVDLKGTKCTIIAIDHSNPIDGLVYGVYSAKEGLTNWDVDRWIERWKTRKTIEFITEIWLLLNVTSCGSTSWARTDSLKLMSRVTFEIEE